MLGRDLVTDHEIMRFESLFDFSFDVVRDNLATAVAPGVPHRVISATNGVIALSAIIVDADRDNTF